MTSKTSRKTDTAATAATADAAMNAGQEAVEGLFKAGAENFEKATEAAREKFEDAMRGYGDMTSFGKANTEALIAASNAYAKGVETFTGALAALSKQQWEESVEAAKSLFGAKSVQEMVDVQTAFAKSSLDALMAEGTKLGELGTRTAQDTLSPLHRRVNDVVETFAKKAA